MKKIMSIITIVLSMFLLCSTVFASGEAIKHDLRVLKDGEGDYILTSMPQGIFGSYKFEESARKGLLSGIVICRKDGKWDNGFLVLSYRSHEDPLIVEAKKNLDFLMYICDKAAPDERVMNLCYYADYNELSIHLHPNQWKDKAIHQEIAEKLNEALNAR